MRFKKSKWFKFDLIAYLFGFITGILSLIFNFPPNPIYGWILITLAILNIGITLMRRIG